MKKNLLFVSLLLICAASASSQITITQADILTPVNSVIEANDTLPTISVGSGGTNQTWNMMALGEHTNDTLLFLPYSSAPNINFSTSNLVVKQGWQDNLAYFISSPDSLIVIGNHGEFNFAGAVATPNQKITPNEKVANLPFTYLSSTASNYRTLSTFYLGTTVMGFQVDSIRDRSSVNKTIVTDGWGTLTTPMYPGISALRTLETKITYDSIDAYVVVFGFGSWQADVVTSADSSSQYVWWANGVGFPVVTARMDSLGAVKSVTYINDITVGLNSHTQAENAMAFPNPAQDQINIIVNPSQNNRVTVYDLAGRIIDEVLLTEKQTTINTTGYANGIYTFNVSSKDKTIINRGKFIISK